MKKNNRVCSILEFNEIIKVKKCVKSKSYAIYYNIGKFNYTRVGIRVSKKNGIAVKRNLIKRQVRSMFDEFINYSDKIDLIIVILNSYDVKNYQENKNELEILLKKILKGK